MAVDNIATLGIKVDPRKAVSGSNKSKRAIKGIGKAAKRVKSQIFSLNSALGALGAGMVLRSALKYTSTVENLEVRLKFLTGSTEDAGKAFKTMLGFAKEAPFTLQEIQNASPSLLTVADNVDELNQLLEITGDIAAVSGLSFETVGQQLQRSFSGGIAAADLFRDSGVKAMLGFQTGVKYTAEETKEAIVKMWEEGGISMVGATKELAKTFTGQVSMMGDAWDALMLTFMKEGIFDETKTSVQEITEWLKSPEAIQGAKDLGAGIRNVGLQIKDVITSYMALPEWVRNMGLLLALFGGIYGRAALVTLGLFADKINAQRVNLKDYLLDVKKGQHDALIEEIQAMGEKAKLTEKELKRYEALREQIDHYAQSIRNLQKDILDLTNTENTGVTTTKLVQEVSHLQLDYVPIDAELVPHLDELEQAAEDAKVAIIALDAEVIPYQEGMERASLATNALGTEFDNLDVAGGRWQNRVTVMGEELLDFAETVNTAQEQIQDFSEGLANNIEDSIMQMTQGLMSFKDVVKSVFRYVAQEMLRMNVAKPFASFLSNSISGMLFGGGGGNSYGFNSSGGFLGEGWGSRALGGTAQANQPYMVGERGAELFVPNQTGTIIPNNALASKAETNVNISFNITANDTEGFDELLESRRGMIVGLINNAMNDRGTLGVT